MAAIETSFIPDPVPALPNISKKYQKLAISIQCCSDLKRPQHARNCFPTAVATKIRNANSKSHPCFVPFCPLRLSPYPKSQKNIKKFQSCSKIKYRVLRQTNAYVVWVS